MLRFHFVRINKLNSLVINGHRFTLMEAGYGIEPLKKTQQAIRVYTRFARRRQKWNQIKE